MLAVSVLIATLPAVVMGHAFIYYPPMRGGAEPGPNNDWCPQCLGSVDLPMDTCGKSKFLDWTEGPVTELQSGGMVEFEIRVTAHHKGHFEFKLCNQMISSSLGGFEAEEQCLNEHVLERVRPERMHDNCEADDTRGDCVPFDESNPGYWYVPPPGQGSSTQVAGEKFTDADATKTLPKEWQVTDSLLQMSERKGGVSEFAGIVYKFHYWIPEGFSCDRCTLQFGWKSANSGSPHQDAYNCYFQHMESLGWSANAWCPGVCTYNGACPAQQGPPVLIGEEFKNCADVRVVVNGTSPSTTQTTAEPTSEPETTVQPTSPPTTQPVTTAQPTLVPTTQPPTSTPGPVLCRAVPDNAYGATDEKCTHACSLVDVMQWPCADSTLCDCTQACRAVAGNQGGATDEICAETCSILCTDHVDCPWPCDDSGLCECPSTPLPTTAPATTSQLVTTAQPGTTTQPGTTATPLPVTTPAPVHDCTSCKSQCQTACSMNLRTNQCWGTPLRYVECECLDGTTHSFPGCECLHADCGSTSTPPPATTPPETTATAQPGTTIPPATTLPPNPNQPAINVCYFTNWARYRQGMINVQQDMFEMGLDGELCTHFMYGFAKVTTSFEIMSSDPNADHPSGSEQQDGLCKPACNDPSFQPDHSDPNGVRCDWPCDELRVMRGYEGMTVGMKAKNPGIKALISVGGWNFNDCSCSASACWGSGSATCEIFSTIASSIDNIKTFTRNVITFCRKWGFDGFDLDWEYPVVAGHNSNVQPYADVVRDYENYITMLRVMKEEFLKEDPSNPLLLTAAVGIGNSTAETAYNIAAMNEHLDLINLMTYDIHGGWESRTGCNAPLWATDEDTELGGISVSWAVDYWIAQGASPSKLTMGIGTYGRGWKLKDSSDHGHNAPCTGKSTPGTCTKEAGYMAYYEILDMISSGKATRVYDSQRACPHIVTNDGEWIGYDDAESIQEKLDFLKTRGLRGTMVWALDLDDFSGLYSNFSGSYSNFTKFPLIGLLLP